MTSFLSTPAGPLFENPDLAAEVISQFTDEVQEIEIWTKVMVPDDSCAESPEHGIVLIARKKNGGEIRKAWVAQGMLARMTMIDLFGKRRVTAALASIRGYCDSHGISMVVHDD